MHGVIFLTGSPAVADVLNTTYPPDGEVLPEFEHEGLTLRKRRENAPGLGGARWSAIATKLPLDEQEIAHANAASDLLDSRCALDGAGLLLANAKQSTNAEHKCQELLDNSLRLREDGSSFVSAGSREDGRFYEPTAQMQALSRLDLTIIDALPDAAYLKSIAPQTMTVNLLVGLMSEPSYRTVRSAKSKQPLTLLEFVVGDHSRSGFSINIWLGPDGGIASPLYVETLSLRRGRLVLLRNIALHSFRDRVHGQNLHRDLTRIEVIHPSCSGDRVDRARNWVVENIVLDSFSASQDTLKRKVRGDELPPDTQ